MSSHPSLAELADRRSIDDLLIRYAVAIDTKDWALLDTCFTADAHVDYTESGGVQGAYPEVRRWLEKVLALFPVTQHLIGNTVVQLHGDRATARTYVFNPMGSPKPEGGLKMFYVGAYYNDVLERGPEGWRIARRIEELAFFDGGPDPSKQSKRR
jgi:3-phenylpropionate/cinnamic acid dioxygenase small subunit